LTKYQEVLRVTRARLALCDLTPDATILSRISYFVVRSLAKHTCIIDAIQDEMELTKVYSTLYELKARILRLTANGPAEYKGSKFMSDALRDVLKGEMWAVTPIVECEVKALRLNDAAGYLVNILRTNKSMGAAVYQGSPSGKRTIPVVAMKADEICYGEYRATTRYQQRRHSLGGSKFRLRETHTRCQRKAENLKFHKEKT
jgi:hypothetical protein